MMKSNYIFSIPYLYETLLFYKNSGISNLYAFYEIRKTVLAEVLDYARSIYGAHKFQADGAVSDSQEDDGGEV